MKPGDQVAVTILGTVVYADSLPASWLAVETASSGWLVTFPTNVAGVTVTAIPDGTPTDAELPRLWRMLRTPGCGCDGDPIECNHEAEAVALGDSTGGGLCGRLVADRDRWKARAELAEERLDDNAWQRITNDRDRLAERLTAEQEQRARLAAQVQRVRDLVATQGAGSYVMCHALLAALSPVLAEIYPDVELPEADQ